MTEILNIGKGVCMILQKLVVEEREKEQNQGIRSREGIYTKILSS